MNHDTLERHRAVVKLSRQELEVLLQLPDGMRIVGVHDDWVRFGVEILIEGDELESVPEHINPPVLHGRWQFDTKTQRLHWTSPLAVEETT